MNYIEIVDSLPGNGKTFSTLRYIEQQAIDSKDVHWLYCTEYLTEIEKRITDDKSLARHLWRTPTEVDKTEKLIELLLEPKVQLIAITHALLVLVSRNEYVNSLFKAKGYSLFLDETIDLINPYNGVKQGDFMLWKKEGKLKVHEPNGLVEWLYSDEYSKEMSTSFDRFALDTQRLTIHCHIAEGKSLNSKGRLSIVEVESPSIFYQFNRVILATYQVEHSLFDAYLQLKGIARKECTDIVCNKSTTKESIRSRITMYDKFNDKFKGKALSSTWWGKAKGTKASVDYEDDGTKNICTKDDIKLINAVIRNIGDTNGCRGDASLLGFTVPARKIGKSTDPMSIYPRGYPHTVCYVQTSTHEDGTEISIALKETDKSKSAYIPCNARASEDYKNKVVMVHAYNRFPLTPVTSYLSGKGVVFSSEVFALNELLQWLWRSAIRSDQEITVSILSERMRNIFLSWLNL